MERLNYGRHWIDEDDVAAVAAVLRGDFLTQGPAIERFEVALAERVGARFAVAVNSGTAALHVACLAGRVGPGDIGVTSPITFVASANCLRYCGAEVELADIDPASLCMEAATLGPVLERHPGVRAIIPVHFGGLAPDMKALRAVAGDRLMIEDASHSLGADYADGRPVGCCAHSDMTVFSFHPVKPMTTAEGGAVTTNDPELARRLRLFRNHGIERERDRFQDHETEEGGRPKPWLYEQQELGFNYRLPDLLAALGLSQLGKLDGFIARRRAIAQRYDRALAGRGGMTPLQNRQDQRARSGHHLYVLELDAEVLGKTRTRVIAELSVANIGSQVHYIPVYRQPYHAARMTKGAADFPHAETYYRGCLSLPIFPTMTDADVDRVVAALVKATGT